MIICRTWGQIYAPPCTRSAKAADASQQMCAFEISSLFVFFSFIRLLFIYLSYFLFPSSAVKPREKFAPNIFCSSAINDKLASLSIFNVLISLQNTFIALRFIYRLKSMWELSLYKYLSLLWRKYGADFRP